MTPELRDVCARFGIAAAGATRFEEGLRNRAFLIEDEAGGRFVLTQLIGHDEASAASLLGTLDHVVAHGLATHRPLRTTSGGRLARLGHWPWFAAPHIEGDTLSQRGSIAPDEVARLLAQIHAAAPPSHLARRRRRLPGDWRTFLADLPCPELEQALKEVEGSLGFLDAESVAFIHGDAFPDNVIAQPDGPLAVIDWENAAVDHPLIDLGIAAVGMALTGGDKDRKALLSNYAAATGRSLAETLHPPLFRYCAVLLAFDRFVRHRLLQPGAGRASSHLALLHLR